MDATIDLYTLDGHLTLSCAPLSMHTNYPRCPSSSTLRARRGIQARSKNHTGNNATSHRPLGPKTLHRAVCCATHVSYTQELATRSSAEEVRKEMLKCYDLIQKLGKGVVYLGSSRTKTDHPHFMQAMELGREVALLLDCTTWTGVGPGMMDAVVKGALKAGKPIGGFKISKEAGEWTSSNFHPYLESHVYYTCRFFSARKHGLVDAAVREEEHQRTAFVALPGGIGTVDEVFEILTLMQLDRIGSKYPVPFLLMNYDGFYIKLLDFLSKCKEWGCIAEGEVEKLWTVCDSNKEALDYLADFYGIKA